MKSFVNIFFSFMVNRKDEPFFILCILFFLFLD
jgi:hypothetical protein